MRWPSRSSCCRQGLLEIRPRYAKVEQLGMPVRLDQDVPRFDIAMHDASPMRSIECGRELGGQAQHHREVKRAARDHVVKREAANKLHYNEQAVFSLADVINGDDGWVIQSAAGSSLMQHTLAFHAGVDSGIAEHFDGDIPTKPIVVATIDDAHSAAAYFFHDKIVRNTMADHRDLGRRCGEEFIGGGLMRQKRFDLLPQAIVAGANIS
jgi:hypothetical protein